jgi:hypothetical protein
MTQEQSIIVGRRTVELDLERKEQVILGEQLPAEYEAILKELEASSRSETFTQQAKKVIYYFYSLDEGKELVDESGKIIDLESFARLVASLHFVTLLYTKARRQATDSVQLPQPADASISNTNIVRRRVISMGNPDESFPEWIKSRVHRSGENNQQDFTQLNDFYQQWVAQKAKGERKGEHGLYAQFDASITPEVSSKEDAFFKGYIEVETSKEKLERAFATLSEREIHPHESKMFDGSRIVLYWTTEPTENLLAEIKQAFGDAGVTFRGPGQDSIYFVRKPDGEIETDTRASNDQALGEGGNAIDFKQDEFDKTEFLRRYLLQCYKYWRNPVNPYELSFVPVFDKQDQGDPIDMDQVKARLTKEAVLMDSWVPELF